MAEINWVSFAAAVADAREERGLSLRQAVERFPRLNTATISHAEHAVRISAGNYAELCRCLGLDPFEYIVDHRRVTRKDIAKRVKEQAVKAAVPRETRDGRAVP